MTTELQAAAIEQSEIEKNNSTFDKDAMLRQCAEVAQRINGETTLMTEKRMDAYYYSFRPTGCEAIDNILSAIACAGKAFHHTSDWYDDLDPKDYGEHLKGNNPVEWIQNAANDAAKEIVK